MNKPTKRRAVSYVFVMGTAMIVTITGLSVITASRIKLRTVQGSADAIAARYNAQSAIEIGLAEMQLDENWRVNKGDGTWFTQEALGSGRMDLELVILSDADSNPDNNPIILYGIGHHGMAEHKIEVTLEAVSEKGGLRIQPGTWKHIVN